MRAGFLFYVIINLNANYHKIVTEVIMGFSVYKNISTLLKEYQITYTESNFIVEKEFHISDYFREHLEIIMEYNVVDNSEFAICEFIISPVLQEVWKQYRSKFILWSHQSLNYEQNLTGFPEYILAKRSLLGKVVFEQPYFLLVEAKQDNFETGWAQCLAEMIAAQKLNANPDQEVFGIVSNGGLWQFSYLKKNVFTRNKQSYLTGDLNKLFASINYIFDKCESLLDNFQISNQ